MHFNVNERRVLGVRDIMLYGHFIEHFHRQIYDGIYDPGNPLSDEDGFRTDIIEAMKKIKVPILRWPGGCFVSSYHWKDAVGEERIPLFDKAWRVEDPNTFGTDEYIKMCRKIGCEPYICTNAGTGTAEEMSDWVEYCNLENEGRYAKWRIKNGYEKPHKVKYWSIGNENYGHWEIGAWDTQDWGRLVLESAKMMKHVDPEAELSAAAIMDRGWTFNLLQMAGKHIDWISLHQYWDMMPEKNEPADYEACMAFTHRIDHQVDVARGFLKSLDLEDKIKIAFDEWNLRSWHHPNVHTLKQGVNKEDYVTPRDKNDINSMYTMADAVFSACFLNAMNRNCDIVKMANFAPILNTRGCIYSNKDTVVLRSTYHVYDLFVNYMGDKVLDIWSEEKAPTWTVKSKAGEDTCVETLDVLATSWTDRPGAAISAVNKHAEDSAEISFGEEFAGRKCVMYTLNGPSKDSYNDVDRNEVQITCKELGLYEAGQKITLEPHSVNVIQML